MAQEYISRRKLEENASLYAESSSGRVRVRADYLVFNLGRDRVAIDIRELDEIGEVSNGIGLPQTHPSVLGLISLRGETVLLFDLPLMTGNGAVTEPRPDQRVLVLADDAEQRWAFLVERIEGVVILETASFQQTQDPGRDSDLRGDLISAVAEHDGKSLALLNTETLIELARECL